PDVLVAEVRAHVLHRHSDGLTHGDVAEDEEEQQCRCEECPRHPPLALHAVAAAPPGGRRRREGLRRRPGSVSRERGVGCVDGHCMRIPCVSSSALSLPSSLVSSSFTSSVQSASSALMVSALI